MKNISKVFVIALLLSALFTIAAVLGEPWNTILFLVAIPLFQQLIKLYFDKTGKTLGKMANQAISLVLALIFAFLSGGFAGIKFPAFPAWEGELLLFIDAALVFVGELSVLIGAVWGSLMVLYEAIWDKLFIKVGLATEDKL